MTTVPNAPRVLKAGLALIDPDSGRTLRMISMQYNPDSLSRTLQVQGAGGEGGNRSEPLRLKGPAIETIKLEAEIDAADQLEFPDQNPDTVQHGIQPQLAALESLVNPTSAQLLANNAQTMGGTLEIMPMEAPLALFVWGGARVLPVRVTELSITEEAFDKALNPIRAKVSLGLRVMSVDDFPMGHRGAGVFLAGLQAAEQLAAKVSSARGALSLVGL
jgi:hypothetical protein